jgi:flagellar hook-length control protein FliK
MQNLPFLVTQNTATQNATLKNAVTAQSSQISSESNSSFKEVLSKQVENEASKKNESQPAKTVQTKSPQNQTQHSAKAPQSKSESEKNEVEESSDADKTDPLTTPQIAEVKPSKLSKDDSKLEDGEEVAAKQLQDGTLPNGLTLPINNTNVPLSVPLKGEAADIDSQKRVQLDANLRSALGQTTKALGDGNNNNGIADKGLDASTLSESATDNKWLDSMLPKMHQQAEVSDPLVSKLSGKLATESGMQLPDTFSTKLKKEAINTLTMQPANTPVLAQVDIGKLQSASSNFIQPSPGRAGWDQAISQKVVWMVGAAEQTATLTLNPPDLGPLQVVINVNNEKADTTFISENPEVRRALENGIPALRGLLDQAGVQLGQANVSTSQQQQEFQQAEKGRSQQGFAKDNVSKSIEAPVATRTNLRTNNGLVDTFA